MSTHGLVGFQINGVLKATYNHSDSYPKELGCEIMDFMSCLPPNGINKLKENVKKLRWVKEESTPNASDIKNYAHFSIVDSELESNIDWYNLLRLTQSGKALPLIFANALDVLIDDTEFLNSPFDCEWAYIINFDENTLDVYKGSRKRGAKCCSMVFSSPLNNCASAEQWLVDLGTAIKNLRRNKLNKVQQSSNCKTK